MSLRLAIAFLMVALQASALDWRVNVPESASDGQGTPPWVWDEKDSNGFVNEPFDGFVRATFSGAATNVATLTLQTNLPAGDWYAWVWITKACSVGVTIDGQTNWVQKTTTSSTPEAVRVPLHSGVSGFSSVLLHVGSAIAQAIDFYALTLTTEPDYAIPSSVTEIQSASYLFFRYPAVTDTTDSDTGNLIYNSSLELPLGDRWGYSRNEINPTFRSVVHDFGKATDGALAFPLVSPSYATNASASLLTGNIAIADEADGTRNPYTFSFRYIATNSFNGTLSILPLVASPGSTTASNVVSRTNTSFASITVPFTPGTNRFTVTVPLDTTPSPFYRFSISHVQSPSTAFLDEFMLQKGSAATTWAPMWPAEWQLQGTNIWNDYDLGTATRPFRVITYNTGAEFERTLNVEESGLAGVVFTNYTATLTIPAGKSTNTVNLRTIRNGPVRVVAWADDMPGHREEAWFTAVKLHTPTPGTNTWILTHWETSLPVMEKVAGYFGNSYSRNLSPGKGNRAWIANPSNGVFDFSAADAELAAATNFTRLIYVVAGENATATSKFYPDHWTNAGPGILDVSRYTNWLGHLAAHYGTSVEYESWNEPHLTTSVDITDTNKFAEIIRLTHQVITNAAPGARVWSLGGVGTPGNFLNNSWANVPGGERPTLLSFHDYDPSDYILQGNDPKPFNRVANMDSQINWAIAAGAQEILDSECGGYDSKGKPVYYPLFPSGSFSGAEQHFEHAGMKRLLAYDSLARFRTHLRWVFRGKARVAYYTGARAEGPPYLYSSSDSGWFLDGTLGPQMANLSLFDAIFGYGEPVGPITTSQAWVEAYLGKAANGQSFAVLWCQSSTNAAITLTDSRVGLLDQSGNTLQTNATSFQLNWQVKYLVSSLLTTNELASAIAGASVSLVATDVTAPRVQILTAPNGQDPHPLRARWLVVDERSEQTYRHTEGLLSRWRVDGGEWSPWSARMQADFGSLPDDATYTLDVEGRDKAGNTTIASGPSFTLGTPAPAPDPDPTGDLSVGTLQIETWSFSE